MSTIRKVLHKNVTPITQNYSTTCWYASLQMIYNWSGKSKASVKPRIVKSQTKVQRDSSPPVADFQHMFNNGIGKRDLVPVARALGLEWGGGDNTTFDIQPLLYVLHNYGPIWVAGSWHQSPHVIVVIGAKAAKVPMIWYLNPWSVHGGMDPIETQLNWLNKGRGTWKNWHASHMFNKFAGKKRPMSDFAKE